MSDDHAASAALTTARPLKGTRTAFIGIGIGAIVTATVVAFTPPDAALGPIVRMLFFHGASTWVNLMTFTATALCSAVFLLSGRSTLFSWSSSLRWVSLPLWMVNSILGVLSMKIVWGGILWREPRLQMSFWVLFGALVIVMVDLLLDNARVTAALDVLGVGALWAVTLATPRLLHPDNPVFNSTDPLIPRFFIGMVVAFAVTIAFVVVALRVRLGRPAAPDAP